MYLAHIMDPTAFQGADLKKEKNLKTTLKIGSTRSTVSFILSIPFLHSPQQSQLLFLSLHTLQNPIAKHLRIKIPLNTSLHPMNRIKSHLTLSFPDQNLQ